MRRDVRYDGGSAVLRRCGSTRAHEADRVAVGVLDDRVARAPERVVRRLLPAVARAGEVREEAVDLIARLDPEADDTAPAPAGPTRVPLVRERHAVEIEVGPAPASAFR